MEFEEMGYVHKVQKVVKEDNEEILPNIHRIATLLKRWLLEIHQSYLNKNKLGYYLDEYVFRYNRRASNSRGILILQLHEQDVITEPLTYRKIIKEKLRVLIGYPIKKIIGFKLTI
jgi:hypothetical protein